MKKKCEKKQKRKKSKDLKVEVDGYKEHRSKSTLDAHIEYGHHIKGG